MDRFVSQVKRCVNSILGVLAALLLLVMTLLVLYQVFTRKVLNDPADFTEELVRYFLIWTGFIGAAYAFGTREHMALLYFRDKLPPMGRKVLMVAMDALILAVALFVIVIGGTKLSISAQRVFSALLGFPRSLVYAVAPISGVFIILIQLINIYEDIKGTAVEGGELM